MKTRTFLAGMAGTLIILLTNPVSAQKDPVKFGKIEMSDLEMPYYEQDTSASAVVLADFGQSNFIYTDHSGFQLQFKRTTRIKFFRKEGFEYATGTIPLYHSTDDQEKVLELKGFTYNLVDGDIVKDKLTNDAIFTEEVNENWNNVKFTMPNIREGSVTEYTYTVISDFFFNLQSWYFQHSIPAVWSEYRVTIPEYFFYNKSMFGYEPLTINESTTKQEQFTYVIRPDRMYSNENTQQGTLQVQSNCYRMAMQDVPAFKSEAFMTSKENYLTKIDFELSNINFPNQMPKSYTQTWEAIDALLNKDDEFGGQLTKKEFVKDLADAINLMYPSPQEKAEAAFDLVKNTMAWNNRYSIYATNNIRKAFNEKEGNVADINLVLIALFKGVGLESYPVIISTRDHGIIHPSHPTVSKFNYLIAQVKINDKTYLVDATEKYSPLGLIPFRCLNFKGRIIKPQGSDWIMITPDYSYKQIIINEMTLTPEGLLTGTQSIQADGYAALDLRKEIHGEGSVEAYVDKIKEKDHDIAIQSFEIEDLDSLNLPVALKFQIEFSNQTTSAGDLIYFNPMLTYGLDENPFKLEERNYPVDFGYALDRSYIMKFTIPEEYAIEEQPQNAVISLPDNGGKFTYNVTLIGNMLQVMSKYTVTKPLLTPDQYETIKEYFNQIVQKQDQQVVLKRNL